MTVCDSCTVLQSLSDSCTKRDVRGNWRSWGRARRTYSHCPDKGERFSAKVNDRALAMNWNLLVRQWGNFACKFLLKKLAFRQYFMHALSCCQRIFFQQRNSILRSFKAPTSQLKSRFYYFCKKQFYVSSVLLKTLCSILKLNCGFEVWSSQNHMLMFKTDVL